MRLFTAIGLAATTILSLSGYAMATPVTAFDSTGEAYNHGQYIGTRTIGGTTAVGPLAQSFITPNFEGRIQSISLDLDCNQNDGSNGTCGTGASTGNYGNTKQVTSAVSNQNTLTLTNATGITVGSWIMGGGPSGITPGTVYVTAINGNTVTLSKPVTIGTNAVQFLADGSFTVDLYGSTVTGISHTSTALTLASVPTGPPLASYTVFDAGLYLQFGGALDTTAPLLYSVANPFGDLSLAGNTAYWIQLNNNVPNGTSTLVEWDFMKGASGTGVAGNYWTSQLADNTTCPSHPTACSWLDGGSSNPLNVAGEFGLDVSYVPEPTSLALLVAGLVGLTGSRRLRWRRT